MVIHWKKMQSNTRITVSTRHVVHNLPQSTLSRCHRHRYRIIRIKGRGSNGLHRTHLDEHHRPSSRENSTQRSQRNKFSSLSSRRRRQMLLVAGNQSFTTYLPITTDRSIQPSRGWWKIKMNRLPSISPNKRPSLWISSSQTPCGASPHVCTDMNGH